MEEIKNVYLVDSENVGDLWVTHILDMAKKEDEVVVFYTKKSPHMGYDNLCKLMSEGREVKFVKCVEGRNALDFQLVTELGFRIGSDKEETCYIMVTNDTGFDAVVQYWKNAGKDVRRYNAKYCQAQYNKMVTEEKKILDIVEMASKENMGTEENVADETESKTTDKITDKITEKKRKKKKLVATKKTKDNVEAEEKTEEKPEDKTEVAIEEIQTQVQETKTDTDELLKELVSCLGLQNSGDIHNALTVFLGNEGKVIYQQRKSEIKNLESKTELAVLEKFEKYCGLVFKFSETKVSCPEDFSKFLLDAEDKRKNLNSFRSALQRKYGKENGLIFYNMLKAHIKILNRIQ